MHAIETWRSDLYSLALLKQCREYVHCVYPFTPQDQARYEKRKVDLNRRAARAHAKTSADMPPLALPGPIVPKKAGVQMGSLLDFNKKTRKE